jgi:hypothetical protein
MMKKLDEMPDKNPFKVPDNYFEEVNKKIISLTSGYDMEIKETVVFSRLRPLMLIAASITGFIILSYTAVKLLTPQRMNPQLSEIISEEFPDFYLNDIDILTLEINAADLVPDEEGSGVNKEAIIDYLLLENVEINDIYEHL